MYHFYCFDICSIKNVFFILGATIFYPADAVSCERSIEIAANTKGICFIRTSRPATAVIYKNDEVFEVSIKYFGFSVLYVYIKSCILIKLNILLISDWQS